MITIPIPESGHEVLIMSVPILTALLGLGFLLVPHRILYFMGLRAIPRYPESIGVGRSSFAGAILALGLGCLLLQDPIALQPSLMFMLAVAWSIATFGRVLQMIFDHGWRKRIRARFAIALVLAVIAWNFVDIPNFLCLDPQSIQCRQPETLRGWFLLSVGGLTFLIGLVALFFPARALRLLRLEHRITTPFAVGEPRGTLAGFYMAIGATFLLAPQPIEFVGVVMGGVWILTAIGRLIAMLVDRGFASRDVLILPVELLIGCLTTGFMLRLI